MKYIVAVYGSLRKGMGNHRILEGASFIQGDFIIDMGMVSLGGYPACDFIPPSNTAEFRTDSIAVELYEVDDAGLARLDRLEGCDPNAPESGANYYNRREVRTGSGTMAWVYFIPNILNSGRPEVGSGDWVEYFNSPKLGEVG